MNIVYLILTVFGESAGNVFDRLNFRRARINLRQIIFLGFLGMSFWIWMYIFLTRQPFPEFNLISLGIIALIIGFSFTANVFDYLSLKADDLSLREPVIDSYPIMAGLVGYTFFPDQRNPIFLLAFVTGALIIYWGLHRIKLRRNQKKGVGYLFLSMALYAVLPTLYNAVLPYIEPSYIAGFRVVGILLLACIFLPIRSLKGLTPKRVSYSALSSASCSVAAIASLYAISAYGVVLASLFFMLGPAIRYLASYFILHEKVRRREVVSSIMLTVVVAITAFAT